MSSANEREQESYAQLLAQLEASMGQAREQRCFRRAQAGAHAAALQALSDIESLKVELEGARLDRKHKEEYEVRVEPLAAARGCVSAAQRGLHPLARCCASSVWPSRAVRTRKPPSPASSKT